MDAINELLWPTDLTYGRASLPFSPNEQKLRSPPFAFSEGRIPFPSRSDKDFIYYQTWTLTTVPQRNVDLVQVPGLNEYGGRFSDICTPLLEAGFRVIAPDLPSFGRSTGAHALVEDWHELTEAVRLVIEHIRKTNQSEGKNRKIIPVGGSMGAFIILACSILHPDLFDAFSILCPFIHVSPESRPSKFIEYVAKAITDTPLGRLGAAPANRGKNSGDPKVHEDFMADPQTYHGMLKVRTGLTLQSALLWIEPRLNEVNKRFLCQHGTSDRVCEVEGSQKLFEQCQTPDDQKVLLLYEGVEHDMLRDPGAPKVMQDWIDWLIKTGEWLHRK